MSLWIKLLCVTIQMKATEQYLRVVLFQIKSDQSLFILTLAVTIQMKATEQYLRVVLFVFGYFLGK